MRRVAGSPERQLGIVVGIAFLVRLAWVFHAHRNAAVGDPYAYQWLGNRLSCGYGYENHAAFLENQAKLIASGGAVDRITDCDTTGPLPPTAFYAIGYPLFLAMLFASARLIGVGSENQDLVFGFAHVLLGAMTVYLVARIAQRLFTPTVAIAAAVIVAFWPSLIMMTATAHLETLYLFLLVFAVHILLPPLDKRFELKRSRLVAGAVVLGIAAQVRPLVFLVLPAILIAFRHKPQSWRNALGHTLLVALVMAAVVAPWTIRNAITMPGFVAMTTGSGDALCISRHVDASPKFQFNSPGCLHDIPGAEWDVVEVEKNKENTSRAISWVIHHPIAEVEMWFRRGYYALRDDHEARLALEAPGSPALWSKGVGGAVDRVADGWYFAVLILAAIGVKSFVRDGRGGTRLILGFAAAGLVVPFLLFGDPRYKVPMFPFVAIIAAIGIDCIRSQRDTVAPITSDPGEMNIR